MTDLIIVGDQAYSEAELLAALERRECESCKKNHRPALPPEDIEEVRRRYRWNGKRGGLGGGGGQSNARMLAEEYGVSKRTILRYVRRAA